MCMKHSHIFNYALFDLNMIMFVTILLFEMVKTKFVKIINWLKHCQICNQQSVQMITAEIELCYCVISHMFFCEPQLCLSQPISW